MRRRVPLAAAVLLLTACGGGADEAEAGADRTAPPPASPAATPPPGTVDTAGVGVTPPTAGGQLVDTAAVPGSVDTTRGTPTAP